MNKHRLLPSTALIGAALLCGCHSFRLQDYVSPRITGRVLDAETRAPVPNVLVRKVTGDQAAPASTPPKGGEQMLASDQVHTDADGNFEMASQKDVLTFSSGSAYAVRLLFLHSQYEALRTNYSGKHISAPEGDRPPELNAGEIFLHRLER